MMHLKDYIDLAIIVKHNLCIIRMVQTEMRLTLRQIADIRAGHPFRSSVKETASGNGRVIQVRDMDDSGLIVWENLVQTMVEGRKEPDWLASGDIVFSARGNRNFASVVPDLPPRLDKPVVCGPHFFRLKVKDLDNVLPSFLSWQLNQKASQRYLRISAQGSAQVSISRSHLEAIPLSFPPLKKQQAIVALSNLAAKEKHLLERLIVNRRHEMDALAKEILN